MNLKTVIKTYREVKAFEALSLDQRLSSFICNLDKPLNSLRETYRRQKAELLLKHVLRRARG